MTGLFDPKVWGAVPFHFWSAVLFTFGCMVGSFLNVCIHRMPRGMSVVSPPSHCPQCNYSIPWFLNIPLLTWISLRGKCANCTTPISSRYFLVELLTGVAFLGCWLAFGKSSAALALMYCLVLAGFIVATFIDFEHFIIPDEITIGGMVAGGLCSFLVPALHQVPGAPVPPAAKALLLSFIGMAVGAGLVYGVVRIGKLLFGRQHIELPPETRIIFTETSVVLPDQTIPFEDLFYRKTDVVQLEAKSVELIDRCYRKVLVRLMSEKLFIGEESLDPESVHQMEVVADRITLPREAMGFGDVKFMGAIGAFLGWQAAVFSLLVSSVLGAAVGVTLIVLKRQEMSTRLPYGPYIAAAAVIWIFAGHRLLDYWFNRML
jgi:leader peptidase (prepilin peptidase)/N-methyltransferase